MKKNINKIKFSMEFSLKHVKIIRMHFHLVNQIIRFFEGRCEWQQNNKKCDLLNFEKKCLLK